MQQAGPEDTQAALQWLEQAAAAGDADAQFKLGLCRAQGIGGVQDLQAALNWVCQAAQDGNPDARRMLTQLVGQA